MHTYDPLENYLANCGKEEIMLTFAEIEKIIGDTLPAAALTRPAWWANEGGNKNSRHSQAKAWYNAGYKVKADRKEKSALFFKFETTV